MTRHERKQKTDFDLSKKGMPVMKNKVKTKRNFWHNSEIECMLGALKQFQEVQGNTATTQNTFIDVATKMRRHGFCSKTPTQIRRKWFQMKSAFLCYKRGNRDRLLLIPERFRTTIAQFVDADFISVSHKRTISLTSVLKTSTPGPKQQHRPTSALVTREQQQTPAAAPRQKPQLAAMPAPGLQQQQTKSVLKQQARASQAKLQISLSTAPPTTSKSDTPIETDSAVGKKLPEIDAKNFYQRKMDEFATRLKVSQKLICNDFRRMQEALVDFEHHCQSIRDAQWIAFMTNSEIKL